VERLKHEAELVTRVDRLAEPCVVDSQEEDVLASAFSRAEERTSTPQVWAMASMIKTPGMMGEPGNGPEKRVH